MRLHDLERHDWSLLRTAHSSHSVPEALQSLVGATSNDEASRAYWRIDNVVVRQGALFEAAAPVAECLAVALHQCTDVARPWALELLFQLANGTPAPEELAAGNHALRARCRDALLSCSAYLYALLECGTREEQIWCVDLLCLFVDERPTLKPRVVWHFNRFAQTSEEARRYIDKTLAGL